MNFTDLLNAKGIDARTVLVLRHRPREARLRKVLPWLAAERPDVFNAYQQAQGERLEKAMTAARFVASFIGHEAGKALFVGLYAIGDSRPLTHEEYWRVAANAELRTLGMEGAGPNEGRGPVLWFDLSLTEFYDSWKGKLIVTWPPPERSWWRRAHRNEIPVRAIREESELSGVMPEWTKLSLSWQELGVLPTSWKTALSHWTCIYYIFDESDGKGYVGSAYGNENLWGRWMAYAASGHGGNRLLRGRDPRNFLFSILQRVSPDMDEADVVRLESTWKDRLHTREHGLNVN